MRASGLRGMGDGSVVDWDEDGSNVRPGQEASHYEVAIKECGAPEVGNQPVVLLKDNMRMAVCAICTICR